MGTKGKLLIIALLMSGIVSLLVWSKNGERKKTTPLSGPNTGAMESAGPGADDSLARPGGDTDGGDPNHVTPADPIPPSDGGLRIESADTGVRPPTVTDMTSHNDGAQVKPAPGGTQKTYKVESGDSLAKISVKVYGKEKYWRQIYEANKDKMSSPDDLLRVGTTLAIPAVAEAAGNDTVQPPKTEAPKDVAKNDPPKNDPPRTDATGKKTYKVKAGDTLSSIAKAQLGDPNKWKAIYSANKDKLSSPDSLWEGLELQIP